MTGGFAVRLRGRFDEGRGLAEILGGHRRADGQPGVEGEKPGLGDARKIRRIRQVEENVAGALAVLFGELDGLGLHLTEDLLDGRPQ